MKIMQHDEFKNMIVEINDFYQIDNFVEEGMLWYNMWKIKILVKLKLKI